jgi:hypothetical protein
VADRSRSVNPLTLAVVGGAVIVVLIVAALHPPSSRSDRNRSAGGPPGSSGPVRTEDSRPADPATCWLQPADPDPTTSSPTDDETDETPARTSEPIAHRTTTADDPPAGSTEADDPTPDDNHGDDDQSGDDRQTGDDSDGLPTVDCPDVKNHLSSVPAEARAEVDQNLAELQEQITDADDRLIALAADPVDDPNFVQNTILGPLKDRRISTLDRITIAIGRVTTPPQNLAARAPCTLDG